MQQLRSHFWKRWQNDYLNELSPRRKWKTIDKQREITAGSMVLLKEDNQPPLNWSIGRIVNVHPGEDDVIRVVIVKTMNGIYKRSIKKIAILPIETSP